MQGSIVGTGASHKYIVFLVILFLLTGCQLTESGFARTVNNAGAEFSAAANTLSYLHQGKLTAIYAKSSFADYQSKLNGIDQQLPSQSGIPNTQTLRHLLTLYKPAIQAIDMPCLGNACDWHGQVIALQQASDGFLKAAGQ